MNRRQFAKTLATAGAGLVLTEVPVLASGHRGSPNLLSKQSTDIRIRDVGFSLEEFPLRTPLKFGGAIIRQLVILNARCEVQTRSGRVVTGRGSMPLGNVWSFPSSVLTSDQTIGAMKALAGRIATQTAQCKEYGHPLDINALLEPSYLQAALDVGAEQKLAEPIPHLCTLVTASPFDAAIHDAFGKAHERNCYSTYGPDLLRQDLSHYLSAEYKGRWLSEFVTRKPKPTMPVYHLVGAADALTDAEVKQPLADGLPETLPQWINLNGLTHFKIKMNGDNLAWDVERLTSVDRVVSEIQARRNIADWVYSLDFNEKCRHVDYLMNFIHKLKDTIPAAFRRIQYIEQPTARDLAAHRQNVMHQVARLVPVVIDESLTGLDMLLLARQMGYSGVALKTCKGQSHALLMAAAAQTNKMFLCVQDLTCPGAALIQSAGLAAHIPGVPAIEANARQFIPAANRSWESRFPGIFQIKQGQVHTADLTGVGLGAD